MAITLEYNGTRKSLAYWGIALDSIEVAERNLAPSVLGFTRVGDAITDAPVFAYRGKVVLRVDEVGSDAVGWVNGTVVFIGYRLQNLVQSSGEMFGVNYQFANAWHFLENTPFKQFYATRNTDGEVLNYKLVPEVQLFTELDESNILNEITSGAQIVLILQFLLDAMAAQGYAAPFIIGTVDPALELKSYQTRQITCAAALLKGLELSPDVNLHVDYTTDIAGVPTPTLHFLSRASQTEVSLALHNGTDHKSLAIVSRPDLKPASVVIDYKITGSDSGQLWWLYISDKYGPHGQSNAADPSYGLDVLSHFIDLQGWQRSNVNVVTAAVNATHATEATRLNWWKEKSPKLKSDKISGLAIDPASVTVKEDTTGTVVSLATYPRELVDGDLVEASGKVAKWVTITCKASYNIYANSTAAAATTATLATQKKAEEEISVRLQVTDATTGVYPVEVISGETVPGQIEIVDGEGIFSGGLAQQIWDSLNHDQFEGEDVRVANVPSHAVSFANKLNLTGGLAAWAAMDAQIQTIIRHYGTGETSVSFGPTKHNNADALNQLIQWSRPRFVWYPPLARETGSVSSGATMGGSSPKENTDHGSGNASVIGAVYEY